MRIVSMNAVISDRQGTTVRRWAVQAQADTGARPGVSSEESAGIKKLKAENRQLREDGEVPSKGLTTA